jgi:hypothetical protein
MSDFLTFVIVMLLYITFILLIAWNIYSVIKYFKDQKYSLVGLYTATTIANTLWLVIFVVKIVLLGGL